MDFVIGQNATVPFEVRNHQTGALILSGVTIGDWSAYGPASTAAVQSGTTANNRGNGVHSVNLTFSNVATPGIYTLVYDVSAPAEGATSDSVVSFSVGSPVRGAGRLRDLLVAIIRSTGGSVRPSSSINTVTVTDDYWSDAGGTASIAAEDFSGSEIVIIDPDPAALTTFANWPHGRVVSFNATTGAFTLNRTTGITSDTTGRSYALCNVQGTGFMFEQIMEELRAAYDEVQPTFLGSVSVGLTTGANQIEYELPAYLSSVAHVYVREEGANPTDLWDNIAGRWAVLTDRKTLRLDDGLGFGAGYNLRVEGAIRCELPKLGGGWTDMPWVWLRERVRFGLFSSSPNPNHQRAAGVIYGNLARMPNPHRVHIPGEVRLG